MARQNTQSAVMPQREKRGKFAFIKGADFIITEDGEFFAKEKSNEKSHSLFSWYKN